MNSTIQFKGEVSISVIRDGNLINFYKGNNLVVDGGKDYIFGRLINNQSATDYDEDLVTLAPLSIMRLGAGIAPPRVSDIELENAFSDAAFTSQTTMVPTSGMVDGQWYFRLGYKGIFPAHAGTSPFNITEAGLYVPVSGAATPRLIARIVFPQIAKSPVDTVEVNWTISMA